MTAIRGSAAVRRLLACLAGSLVVAITGICFVGNSARSFRATSHPLSCGSIRSITIKSGRQLVAMLTADRPSPAVTTVKPRVRRKNAHVSSASG